MPLARPLLATLAVLLPLTAAAAAPRHHPAHGARVSTATYTVPHRAPRRLRATMHRSTAHAQVTPAHTAAPHHRPLIRGS